jgi:biotin carboxyl carrier protein
MSNKTAYLGENAIEYSLNSDSDVVTIGLNGFDYQFHLFKQADNIVLKNMETGLSFYCHQSKNGLVINGKTIDLRSRRPVRSSSEQDDGNELTTPMPGKIIKLYVQEGNAVEKGAKLYSMEAMKMEHTITAPFDATIKKVHFQEGDQVEAKVFVVELEEKS